MNDLISIIVPVYNRQNEIQECIRSILSQSHQSFEIILIDDGSSDQTLEICRSLAQEDPRIKLLAMEHAGVSAARNKGLETAQGDFIFFLDSDDVIHPLLLESLVSGMKNSNASIAGSGIVYVPEKYWDTVSKKIEASPGPGETTFQNHQDSLRAFFHTTSPINLIGGVMMRRELISETRFATDLFIGEDFYFIYQNLIKGASSIFLKQRWYYCRLHTNNSSRNFTFSGFWTRFYRRKLVWESEQALGREEFANIQKRDAFNVYLKCLQMNKLSSHESKKIRKVMKDYKAALLPAMAIGGKARYYFYVYLPFIYFAALYMKKQIKKLRDHVSRK